MYATEARTLTEHSLQPDINALVQAVDQRIAAAARNGNSHIINPEIGHKRDGVITQLTIEQRRALRHHYEERGFHWRHNPNADHPCCRGLTTLSW